MHVIVIWRELYYMNSGDETRQVRIGRSKPNIDSEKVINGWQYQERTSRGYNYVL